MEYLAVTEGEELKELAALAHEIWNEYFPCILEQGQIDYMVEKFQSHEAISRQISEEGYRYFLLREEGDTAGYAGICPRDGKLFLSKLYLRRQFRGRGLASQAFAFLEGYCARTGLPAVWLTVNRNNTHAIDVYRRRGYRVVREQRAEIGGGYFMDDFVMEKSVAPVQNRVLIVIDMQRDFVTGALGSHEAQAITGPLAALIERRRKEGWQLVFTLDTHGPDYLSTAEGKKLPVRHCIRRSEGHGLVSELCTDGAALYCKGTFGCRALAEELAFQSPSCIELAGVCTDICVISNALLLKAFLPECPIAVHAGCCAGVTAESHENALRAMAACQIEIVE